MRSLITTVQKVEFANAVINAWTASNVYMILGQIDYWDSITDSDAYIPPVSEDVLSLNDIRRNSVAMKKITGADMVLVVPRIDWTSGTVYDEYRDNVDLLTTKQNIEVSGNVNVSSSSAIVNGSNTKFLVDFAVGDIILIAETPTVSESVRQVVSISSNTVLGVNTVFTTSYVANSAYKVLDTSPYPALSFYVRNTQDQVFKCLSNNGDTFSIDMPLISLAGKIPQNPWIETSDGYKWKYLYTIPQGQKRKFLSAEWMPVYTDALIRDTAIAGSIPIVEIGHNGNGSGYHSNVAGASLSGIVTIEGDGTGAEAVATVNVSGSITNVFVTSVGADYSYANVVLSSNPGGSNANIVPIIVSQGGHGYSPVHELGAKYLMVSLDFNGTENNTVSDSITFRQTTIVSNPVLLTSGIECSNTNYNLTDRLTTQTLPEGLFFTFGEFVYQGANIESSTWNAQVVDWDNFNNYLYVTSAFGEFDGNENIKGTVLTTPSISTFNYTPSVVDRYSGLVFHVNNASPVTRSEGSIEQLRTIMEF